MKYIVVIILIVVALSLALPVRAPKGLNATPPRIKIGVILPLTGEVASYGEKVKKGILSAKIPGVELIFEDSACRSAKALAAYNKLARIDGVQYFLGPCCGASISAVAPYLAKGKQLSLSTCGVSESLRIQAGNKLLITQYSIEKEDAFLAARMWSQGIRKVGVVFMENDFSLTHVQALQNVVATMRAC